MMDRTECNSKINIVLQVHVCTKKIIYVAIYNISPF